MKKKVIFFIESFIVGGAEKVLIDIVNNLDAEKYDITVCSIFKHSVYKEYNSTVESPFVKHVKYKFLINNKNRIAYLLFNYLLARIPRLLYSLLVGDKYDTVVAFYEGTPTYWVANAKLAKAKKIAWLHTSTELSQNGKSKSELEKQNKEYKQYNQIISVSKSVANSFTSLFPDCKNNIQVIYNPININNITKKSKEISPVAKLDIPTFISVGRSTAVKGYDRILRVSKMLKENNFKFQWWIVGGGRDTKKISKCIEEFKLENFVHLLGNRSNPYNLIYNADYYVSSSYTEGLGMTIIEALALCKPVICSNFPAAKEIIEDVKYGIIYEQTDQAMYDVIESTIKHHGEKKHQHEFGYEKALTFDIKNQIKKISNIL